MPDKKPEWSDYAYDNDSISKRLGIEKDEVKKLKNEAAEKSRETHEGTAQPNGFGIGLGISVDTEEKNTALRAGVKIPGLGVEFDTNGEGSVDIVNLIRVETVRIKCFYIQRFYFAGQFLYSDIQKVDSEECKEPEPEPEPEPPSPNLNDVDENRKPKAPPLMPSSSSNYFDGIYTQTRIIYKEVISPELDLNINYKAAATSIANRLHLHSDPYKDIWRIDYNITEETNSNYVSGFGNVSTYYCLYPSALRGQGVIIYNNNNKLNYYNNEFVNTSRYYCFRDSTRWGGDIRYCPGNHGGPSPLSVVGDIAAFYGRPFLNQGTFCGGFIDGEYQAIKNFIKGGFVNYYNKTSEMGIFIYSHMVETNQIINFADLVPKQNRNPPFTGNKKEKMKECCERSDKLLKRLAKYQGLGQKISPINVKDNKIEEKGGNDENFPMKIPKRWIDRDAKPKDDIEISSMRHLLLSVGIMLDRFEELFNPAGKDNGFPLKKPEEGLWKWLPGDGGDYEAPDPNYDPKKSEDDGKIKNKKLKINSYLDLFRYFLESQIRLELLFPIAQIRDSEISKRLIYPKAPGTIKINDLIQFQELMLLFINKTLGDPSCSVIIKDADPTKEGDQPITFENFDISDMLRKLLRFTVDINSDVDLGNNFSKRTLYQLLSAMQLLVKNHEMTEAIFEDLGMKEQQVFVPVKFFADPYAGAWEAGKGFDPAKIKVENSEANIEANLEAFLQEKEVEIKVSRRAKDETTDIRDLLAQIGRYAAELAAMGKIPNNPEAIQQAIDKARFELQTESALRRTDIRQASAAGRVRTKRNKKGTKKR